MRCLAPTVRRQQRTCHAASRRCRVRGEKPQVGQMEHSAAASAAGYLYQCQAALLELLRRGWDEPELVLFLERLDDVEIQGGDAREALQIKHHSGAAGSLSDSSVDLWRTIAVWLDILPSLVSGEKAVFT